jgi:DNA-binding CsgD family transcriptional regulator
MAEPLQHQTAGADARSARSAALRFRLASRADLPYCVKLLPAGFRASSRVRRHLVDLWGRLLALEARSFTVVEDLERPYPANMEGFRLSVFVTDRFFSQFCASPRPYLSALSYERMLAGEDLVLSAKQLRTANSTTGLNLIVLHLGLRNEDLSDARTAQMLAAGSAAFYFFHAGYRINAILNEVYGPQSARYMQLGGFRLVHDFHRERPADFEDLPPLHDPYLFMLRREWVEPAALHPLSQLFYAPVPRLHFSATERRVLEAALLNESDLQIAGRLGMSVDNVKKTWQSVYQRAGRALPSLIPPRVFNSSASRGQEKRRHLLAYLRLHLEELRPASR